MVLHLSSLIQRTKDRLALAKEIQAETACSLEDALTTLHQITLEDELSELNHGLDDIEKVVREGAEDIDCRLLRATEEFSREACNIADILRRIRDGDPDF